MSKVTKVLLGAASQIQKDAATTTSTATEAASAVKETSALNKENAKLDPKNDAAKISENNDKKRLSERRSKDSNRDRINAG